MKKKVLVGMSGGVDSSVAACLLLEQGYDVAGVTLHLYDNEDAGLSNSRTCCSLADVEDARSVARHLGIEHYVFNFGPEFRKEVIGRFAEGYRKGETPNPCIECNRYIKFGMMLERAKLLGYDYIATGHYAQTVYNEDIGRWLLKKAADRTKDQTYVLFSLSQEAIAHTLFPLGGLKKSEVRKIAEEHGFVNAAKPDSEDICFVPDGNYIGFLENVMGMRPEPGNFVDTSGHVLGKHGGIIRYTIGQRKGLGLSFDSPKYVLRKDVDTNTVVLGSNQELFRDIFLVENVNLFFAEKLTQPIKAGVKIRYSQTEAPATLYPAPGGNVRVQFEEPQRAITPGQAAVFYSGDMVLGGGTIAKQDSEERGFTEPCQN